MSEELTVRLNQILPKLTSAEFLRGQGIGNEIAFHIFDYPPEDELRVREHITFLLEQMAKRKPPVLVAHINLFDLLLETLRQRGLLEKSLDLQREKGNEALAKALRGVLHEEKIARRFSEMAKPEEHDLVLLSGLGSAFPLLRSHTLLNNLHSIMGRTPLVMFYPGRYDRMTLRLFGKTGLGGSSAEGRNQAANYYRAFRLVD